MPNRLALESSPYLQAHGDDPVDWYPWGAEAFEAAATSNRPIFLSIGYASCHWCHVMHRESFSDPTVAAKLNNSFVSIKVDRESRPDVDDHYMAYVVAVTGQGGWPMSVILTPELIPIFGGTYYPPAPSRGMPSFTQVIDQLSGAFANDRAEVAEAADESLEYIRAMFAPLEYQPPTPRIVTDAASQLIALADRDYGGFGGAPKFPQAPTIDFLLARARAGDSAAHTIAEKTLAAIVGGGIFDQIGGGIARYATDRYWVVPHFEKMLYDNAQLLTSLARMQELEPKAEWVHAIRQTAEFMRRDLRADGALASSLDADTGGREGATYVWNYAELKDALTPDELELAITRLGVTKSGNWEGENILLRPYGRGDDAIAVDAILDKLSTLRIKRPQPALDTKMIVSWNALAAMGLVDAGFAIGDSSLADEGISLLRLLVDEAVDETGGVRRLLADPASADVRILEDASALALACLRVAEVADPTFIQTAAHIFDRAAEQFYDGDGTWYSTPANTKLPVRPRQQHDNPIPSDASMAARAALLLHRLTNDPDYPEIAERTLGRQVALAKSSPAAAGSVLLGMMELQEALQRT